MLAFSANQIKAFYKFHLICKSISMKGYVPKELFVENLSIPYQTAGCLLATIGCFHYIVSIIIIVVPQNFDILLKSEKSFYPRNTF